MAKRKETYETTSIQETGWLMVNGFIPTAKVNSIGIIAWNFEDTPELHSSIKEFEGDGVIAVREYNKAISMLKRGMGRMNR